MPRKGPFVTLFVLLALVSVGSARLVLSARPARLDLSAYPWIYLRDGQPLRINERPVEVLAVGDVNLGRGMVGKHQALDQAAPWLQAADLVLGNLECAISSDPVQPPGLADGSPLQPYRLVALPSAAGDLARAGFDILGLANNHALDAGPAGLQHTARVLEQAGIKTVGAGPDVDLAYRPLFRQVHGVRLAFLAFNLVASPPGEQPDSAAKPLSWWEQPPVGQAAWYPAEWDSERAASAVRRARREAEAVIVSIHWGYEYQARSDPAQRSLAGLLTEAGASLVVGHHPHVVQEIEAGESVVAYSLGHFVFDQQMEHTRHGLALRAFFDQDGLRAVQALPLAAGPQPRLLVPAEATPLIERLQPRQRVIAFTCDQQSCRPAAPPRPAAAGISTIFHSAEVDLTGDQIPERVLLEGGDLVILHGGAEAWRSPPEWRVIDAAPGDPDADGRMDLMLALLKPDESGILRSHPFVVGFRGGIYRTLWGGSAVADPVLEVEVGDIDGDGIQELIVLEQQPDGQTQAVTVWRWHGWGFSLQWRSPPGMYQDMLFIPGGDGGSPMIRVMERV